MDIYRPLQYVDHITKIDFDALKEMGFEYLCWDLDNTIAPQGEDEITAGAVELFEDLQKQPWIKDMSIITNIIIGAKRVRRMQTIAQKLGIKYAYPAYFWDKKPHPKSFYWVLEKMKATPEKTVMIGDQIFSDVLGAKKVGMQAVLVKPLGKDHWTTKLTGRRQKEKKLLSQFGMA